MTGRRIPSGRNIHYYDDWRSGWRQVLRKRIDKKLARREDRLYQKRILIQEYIEVAA